MRGIVDHCPTIDFAFVAGNLADTLVDTVVDTLADTGRTAEDTCRRGLDSVHWTLDNGGHWKMDTVDQTRAISNIIEEISFIYR